MISSLSGTVSHVGLHEAVIEVHGVGLLVYAAPGTLAQLRMGEQARLLTHLVVKEDSLTLYGFRDAAEREVFTTMLGVSGIGPRIALAVLSVHSPAQVLQAVAEEAHHRFGATRVTAVLDARMEQVYAASYRFDDVPVDSEPQLLAPEALTVPDGFALAGNAFTAYAGRLPAAAACHTVLPTAAAMLIF